jgi:choline kinase/phosphatidylglycerophosphate synthase
MKCLIIACGQGTRLVSKSELKPLTTLLGLPLIERVILSSARAGLREFYVVTGYHGKILQEHLETFSRKRNIKITCLYNDEWEKENGISVLRAKEILHEKFILLMSDHIFGEGIVRKLKNQRINNDEVILAIDQNIAENHFVDEEDATKVFVEGKKILAIGKNLKLYNAYDTGIFLCTPAIFKAIQQNSNKGDTSLSGAINELAKKGKVRSLDVSGNYWIDVDDEAELKQAEKCLINVLVHKKSDGVVSRYINRPLSMRITKFLLRTNIQPNTISLICFLLSLIGACFLFQKGYYNLLIGAILAQLSSVIDGCDGEIARLKFLGTNFGGWFDAVLDRYADAFLLFGLTHHIYQIIGNSVILLVGFLAIIGSLINSYTAGKYDILMASEGRQYFRIGRDLRIFIIFLGGLFNQPAPALIAIALIMNIENIRRIAVMARNEAKTHFNPQT